jgi:hypothetical protein
MIAMLRALALSEIPETGRQTGQSPSFWRWIHPWTDPLKAVQSQTSPTSVPIFQMTGWRRTTLPGLDKELKRKKARQMRANLMKRKKGFGGATQSRTGLHGFAIRCITALLSRRYGTNDKHRGSLDDCQKNRRFFEKWSGKRGSNSRPQPWQGCALPTELFPREALNYTTQIKPEDFEKQIQTKPKQKTQPAMIGFDENFGVADGARTHDNRNHNPGLYQLSYSHRRSAIIA